MLTGYTIEMLEERIKYTFRAKKLLRQAITHSSYTNEQRINKRSNYETLEFLGDAVLELASSLYLFENSKEKTEGELTKKRAAIVCEQALAFCGRSMELGNFILLGRGEEATGGRDRDSILADVIEAIIGAIFLDGGLEAAKEFVASCILSDMESKKQFYDSKTILQEYVQGKGLGALRYALVEQLGPDHNKYFIMSVSVNDQVIGTGQGKTKKAAEQMAAYEALLKYKKQEPLCI